MIGYSGGYEKCVIKCFELASCGEGDEGPRRVDAALATAITFKTDYTIGSSTSVDHVTALDRCLLTKINYDLTPRIIDRASGALTNNTGRVDDGIRNATSTVPARIGAAWLRLNGPIAVAPQAWLAINPESLRATPLSGSGNTVNFSLGLSARPSLSYGTQPQPGNAPLPPLNTSSPPSNAFHIALDTSADMSILRKQIREGIVGQRLFLPKPFPYGYYVDVTGTDAYGSLGRLVISVSFRGVANGTVYLVGTPTLDADHGIVSIPDLDYTVETRNLLLRLADRIFADRLRDELRARARIDVSARLLALRQQVQAALNQHVAPNVSLSGQLLTLRALPTVASDDALRMRVIADGNLRIDVTL